MGEHEHGELVTTDTGEGSHRLANTPSITFVYKCETYDKDDTKDGREK